MEVHTDSIFQKDDSWFLRLLPRELGAGSWLPATEHSGTTLGCSMFKAPPKSRGASSIPDDGPIAYRAMSGSRHGPKGLGSSSGVQRDVSPLAHRSPDAPSSVWTRHCFPLSDFRFPTSDFRLPLSHFLIPHSVIPGSCVPGSSK